MQGNIMRSARKSMMYERLIGITFGPLRPTIKYFKNRLYRSDFRLEVKRGRQRTRFTDFKQAEVITQVKEWLLRSIEVHDQNGSAAYYSFWGDWKAAYPETTGYIITTLLDYADYTCEKRLEDYAYKLGEWLLSIQLDSGAWQGLQVDSPQKPVAFNTAMILDGISEIYRRTKNDKYGDALQRAIQWLVNIQDEDGCWSRMTYHDRPVTYNSLMCANVLKANSLLRNSEYTVAAKRQLEWVCGQINNGFVNNCDVTQNHMDDPLMHYVGYTLEGLLRSGIILKDDRYFDSVIPVLDKLVSVVKKDGVVYGRYDRNWEKTVDWVCLTGALQIAISLYLAHEKYPDRGFASAASTITMYVSSTINLLSKNDGVRGGVGGSYPIDGGYQRYQYVNWAAKFYMDACLLQEKNAKDAT